MNAPDPFLACVPRKRNRYFTGKFMTAEDFAEDPEYLLAHHRLHQRLAHGWGILHGLDVEPHPEPACRSRFVILQPGLALDSEGRELLLEKPRAVEVVERDAARSGATVLFLRYREEEVEPVPTLYAEEGTVPAPDQAGKVLEGVVVKVVPRAQLDEGEWPAWNSPAPGHCSSSPGRVPLALVRPGPRLSGSRAPDLEIDLFGRRQIGPPTRIEWTSWIHGGHLTPPAVLELGFSAPLAPQSGLDPYTFIVEEGAAQSRRQPVAGLVELSDDRRRARFVFTEATGEATFTSFNLFITLKCDFILDRYGRPIDGGHLGGRLPTGGGVPGGVFESWFHVVPQSRPEESLVSPQAQEEPCHDRS